MRPLLEVGGGSRGVGGGRLENLSTVVHAEGLLRGSLCSSRKSFASVFVFDISRSGAGTAQAAAAAQREVPGDGDATRGSAEEAGL